MVVSSRHFSTFKVAVSWANAASFMGYCNRKREASRLAASMHETWNVPSNITEKHYNYLYFKQSAASEEVKTVFVKP